MGFLDFLFGKKRRVENDFFGTMLFFEIKKEPHKSYFECKRHFKPAGKAIEMAINGDMSGAMEKQTTFFKRIEDNYGAICRAIAPLVESEFKNRNSDFRLADFDKQFEPVYLVLPRCETAPVEWEISFETKLDDEHSFTVTMSGFEAKHILIDG
ncbi:MAG: hypothetical protein LBV47_08005 [Bacteroidales bacterium]|jgi:hypothetical protein|nr:hypothetical protein [Bacteroidales bacterium]